MSILQARARLGDPDQNVLAVRQGMNSVFIFNMRYALLDGTLVPFTAESGTAELVIVGTDGNTHRLRGVNVQDSLWSFDVLTEHMTQGAAWQLDGIYEERPRQTFSFGPMRFVAR